MMTEVRLTKAPTFELDPAKKYLIQIDREALSPEDVYRLTKQLKKMGIENAVFVMLPEDRPLKITEAK